MVVQLNNIKSEVIREQGDDSQTLKKLSHYLSVLSPTRFFVDSFRKGWWDGRERFLTAANFFPTGMLPFIQQFAKDKNIKLTIEDCREDLPALPDQWDYWLGDIELRDYQIKIIDKLYKALKPLYFVRGIINAATNAGKDYVMASIYKNINVPTLIIIHNTEIYRKAVKFFSGYFDVGEICSGKYEPKHFTIAMQKTLLYSTKKDIKVLKYLSTIKCLMVDEGHRAIGKEYQSLLSKINSPIRLLFSGTPLEMSDNAKKLKLIGSFGPVLIKIKNEYLINEGFSQKPTINVYDANNFSSGFTYRQEYENSIINSKSRADIISSICKQNPDKQILISFSEIAHGQFMLDNMLLHGIGDVDMVSGEDRFREEKIERFKNLKLRILLSSMILKEGVNIPNIEILILAHGGKSTITIKQYIGRALRHDGKSDDVKIFDFYDRGSTISKHSQQRIKIYKKEGFDIEYNYKNNIVGAPI